ncbi:cobalamin biosynthesis protein [Streptomyces sp. LX-29]|uniref:cobalamin biosynthesis protein n=1 Tax=Streptomyces sp. LX-29 TaxID=2900152 RepID=UPI00240DF967|nr:cobalamin biosynthesis protein [Streptomyces sp. LX-29]WFB10183.1 cobalamin biosynthesis protein [Streptomyces sp. LX-29]
MVGIGARRGVPVSEVLELIRRVLAESGRCPSAVTALATVAAKAAEPGLVGAASVLGVPVRVYEAAALAAVAVPGPASAAALAAVGTPSVAEAAALLAAGDGAQLLVPKRASASATCAVAHGAAPAGDRP